MGGGFFGVILTSVPMMSIIASVIYLYATSISNAALLKDSIAILFLSEIDEQLLKVIIRVTPTWVDKIEKDISLHNNTMNPGNESLLQNDIIENEDDRAICISDEQSTCEQNSSSKDIDSIIDEESYCVASQLKLLNSQMQEMKKERQIERMLVFEMWNTRRSQNHLLENSKLSQNVELQTTVLKNDSSYDSPDSSNEVNEEKPKENAFITDSKLTSYQVIENFHTKMTAYLKRRMKCI